MGKSLLTALSPNLSPPSIGGECSQGLLTSMASSPEIRKKDIYVYITDRKKERERERSKHIHWFTGPNQALGRTIVVHGHGTFIRPSFYTDTKYKAFSTP